MKIERIEAHRIPVNRRGAWVFVTVRAENGITGIGEASQGGHSDRALSILGSLTPSLVGSDVPSVEAFHARFYAQDEGRAYHTAVSAIEHALWDIKGKSLGVPAHELLGGPVRDQLRLYANINRATVDRTPAGFARGAAQAVLDGFTAVKLAPFDDLRPSDMARRSLGPATRLGIDRVRAVRAEVGEDVDVMVDCHARFSPGAAVQAASELDDLGLCWLEDAVACDDIDGLRHVYENTSMPIATGETVRTLSGFRRLLRERVTDYIMPDVKHVGGILALKKISAMAQAANVLVAPHNPSGPVATAASVQCMATVPNFAILEYAWGEADWRAGLIDPAESVEAGMLACSQHSGLGVALSYDAIARS
ncbi:mandelate racemase/muconate lactonizing enzyme family protein, partial [Candidatus Poribacteria bacterium]|nr:mandelate racemase/muconate lactonizing enzyme family protein [Candidatus Poribacteria bacterium]